MSSSRIRSVQGGPTTITEWTAAVHDLSRGKGFWPDVDRKSHDYINTRILLVICELSEAVEELRAGADPQHVYMSAGGKPEGFPIELADAVIRIMDLCGGLGLNLEEAMRVKAAFNETREHKHGKAF